MKQGKKFDDGKLNWWLLPLEPVEEIIKVLMHGAKKYGKFNWQDVDNYKERYYSALHRHLTSWRKGERLDQETNLPHLAHAGCCLLFLLWKELSK